MSSKRNRVDAQQGHRGGVEGASRRRFLERVSMLGVGLGVYPVARVLGGEPPTAAQTMGPFYPKPAIEKQPYYDADLTRLGADSPVAEGEIHVIEGQIVGLDGEPLGESVVEVWQACLSGRYNHPDDKNGAALDPHFQYCARMVADAEGRYRFKTIQPGKYPGRTPHIHYRVLAQGRPELVTQMYFEQAMDMNRKDGVYKGLTAEQQAGVTVSFASRGDEEGLVGSFRIVMGGREARGATPPM